MKIDPEDLSAVIGDYLADFSDEVRESIDAATKTTAKEVVRELKKGGGFGGSGAFNRGWTSRTEKGRLGSQAIIYNKDLPGLAHLLEFGHAKRNGGRTKAFNFIAPINDAAAEKFVRAIEQSIGG